MDVAVIAALLVKDTRLVGNEYCIESKTGPFECIEQEVISKDVVW
jgi:hypothetical protein